VKGETMLFLADDTFIDVVQEEQFQDVVTVSASSALALSKFKRHSEGKIIINPADMVFPYMVHVTIDSAAHLLQSSKVYGVKKEKNISPEPVAFCFRGIEKGTENPTWGYCWPGEVDDVYFSLDDVEDVHFFPLFEIPRDLQDDFNQKG
jgi:hypothetical protein